MTPPTAQLVAAWLAAARDPAIATDLESLFSRVSAAIAERGPACWASGRCCNFEAAGHRLYTTGLEAAYTVSKLRSPEHPALTSTTLSAALARGGCPFQSANLCGVHTIKPLACRVYFCDKSAQAWQSELLEGLMVDLRALHERHAIAYRYAEWRGLLAMFLR
ncbi:MAG: YkgJ family cysteine cluster protein [Chloroflexi bacterium]|nr:YkgJ family cysteine cluster protein [Chloroflexota bacterium]